MRQRRNTLAGTPTAIAPGAVFLVGEFRLPGEEVTVLAALSRHARAQYFADVAAPSPLVAAAVEHAHRYLGESAAALPAGSVLLRRPEAGEDERAAAFETTAAIAVATVAAVFEMAGEPITERRDEILVVAEAAHRAAYAGIGAEGELAAALYGGLIKVVMPTGAAPRTEALAPLADLHLVVFHTGEPVFPADWLSRLHQFAERDRSGCVQLTSELHEHATRFAAELSAGIATTAIASAGRYGACLSQLVVAASTCPPCASFLRAVALAAEHGGIAKTTNAGHGDLGIAMFPSRDAADRFCQACQPPLIPLGLELDRCGVTRVSQPAESAAVATPVPELGPFSVSAEAIVRPIEDAVTERQVVETDCSAAPQAQGSSRATPAAPETIAPAAEPQPLTPAKKPAQDVPRVLESRRRQRKRVARWLAFVGALFVASFVAVSLGKTLGRREATRGAGVTARVAPASAAQVAAPAERASGEPTPSPASSGEGGPSSGGLPAGKLRASATRSHGLASEKPGDKVPSPPMAETVAPARRPPSPAPPAAPAPRAGILSADDF